MGVALITSVWTCFPSASPFRARTARCRTPKRCCSSQITSPREENRISPLKSAWVPITASISPEAILAASSFLSDAFVEPVTTAHLTPSPSSSLWALSPCCRARISVGAISALWYPAARARNMAPKATAVLPLPTSPWTSLPMARPEARSARISSSTRAWAPVGGKGQHFQKTSASRAETDMGKPSRRSPRSSAASA